MPNPINMADAVQDLYVIGPIEESDAHKRTVGKRRADYDKIFRVLKRLGSRTQTTPTTNGND